MPQIRWMGYILSAIMATGLIVSKTWKPPVPEPFIGIKSGEVPRNIDGFYAPTDYEMTPETIAALQSADIVSRYYEKGPDKIDFVLIGGTDRDALHDPRSCLVGAGWRLVDDHTETLPGTNVKVRVCRAEGLPDQPSFDIAYMYVVDHKLITEVTEIRAQMLLSALIGQKNKPVYFLRYMRPITGTGDPAEHEQLKDFAAGMWLALKDKIDHK